ncbi:MAG: hypothetical protein NC489_39615 [Ruminococcus flavefaciens]|nr:hypothetical protein [Ruminococcus flavefaciens]
MAEMDMVPIVIYHEGRPSYLRECINQAKKFNNTVILIGDESNRDMNSDDWYNEADLETDEWHEFSEMFCNMSTNPAKFELQCFKRFFMIYALMKRDIISECIHIDSDVLCYYDFSMFKTVAGKYVASLDIPQKQDEYRWSAGAITSYWTKEGIASFCNFIIYIYKNKKTLLAEKWNYQKDHNLPGGICDMTLLYLWSKQQGEATVLNTMKEFYNGSNMVVIDNNINSVENYTDNKYLYNKLFNMKKVTFIDGVPYLHRSDGTKIQTLVLHFQGGAKKYMKYYAHACKFRRPLYYLLAVAIKMKRAILN